MKYLKIGNFDLSGEDPDNFLLSNGTNTKEGLMNLLKGTNTTEGSKYNYKGILKSSVKKKGDMFIQSMMNRIDARKYSVKFSNSNKDSSIKNEVSGDSPRGNIKKLVKLNSKQKSSIKSPVSRFRRQSLLNRIEKNVSEINSPVLQKNPLMSPMHIKTKNKINQIMNNSKGSLSPGLSAHSKSRANVIPINENLDISKKFVSREERNVLDIIPDHSKTQTDLKSNLSIQQSEAGNSNYLQTKVLKIENPVRQEELLDIGVKIIDLTQALEQKKQLEKGSTFKRSQSPTIKYYKREYTDLSKKPLTPSQNKFHIQRFQFQKEEQISQLRSPMHKFTSEPNSMMRNSYEPKLKIEKDIDHMELIRLEHNRIQKERKRNEFKFYPNYRKNERGSTLVASQNRSFYKAVPILEPKMEDDQIKSRTFNIRKKKRKDIRLLDMKVEVVQPRIHSLVDPKKGRPMTDCTDLYKNDLKEMEKLRKENETEDSNKVVSQGFFFKLIQDKIRRY